jgi:hypothetical protein
VVPGDVEIDVPIGAIYESRLSADQGDDRRVCSWIQASNCRTLALDFDANQFLITQHSFHHKHRIISFSFGNLLLASCRGAWQSYN